MMHVGDMPSTHYGNRQAIWIRAASPIVDIPGWTATFTRGSTELRRLLYDVTCAPLNGVTQSYKGIEHGARIPV
jgi:hypothetical protein